MISPDAFHPFDEQRIVALYGWATVQFCDKLHLLGQGKRDNIAGKERVIQRLRGEERWEG